MVTLRTIISLAASKGWKLCHLDVKNVFLYEELDVIFLWSSRKDLPLRNILIMCADLRRHCTDSSKLLMLGLVRLLNILILVVLSLHVLIQAYLLRTQQLYAPCSYLC